MTTQGLGVLVVDDDDALASVLSEYLAGQGFQVSRAATAEAGLRELRRGSFDVLVLDVMLPDEDGFQLLPRIRAESDIPVLMLTARGDDTDRIVGLELGADDYLPKPFNPRELTARLRALVRRQRRALAAPPGRLLRFGGLEIDRDRREVSLDGEARELTSYQFDLLVALADNAGRVMSREELMRRVRGAELSPFDRSIDVHVSRIRAAVEDDPSRPRRILTIRSVGYVFTVGGVADGRD